jgi:hypothetical protein
MRGKSCLLRFSREIAQHVFLDLSGRSLGQRTKDNFARALEMSQSFPAESDELLFSHERRTGF